LLQRLWLSPPTATNYGVEPEQPVSGAPILLRPCLGQHMPIGTGIFTCLPSTTPFGLVLGPDARRADEPATGTLRFSARGILTLFITTHACICTSKRSSSPLGLPSMPLERSSTTSKEVRSFGS